VDIMPDLEVRIVGYRRAESRNFRASAAALVGSGRR